MKRRSFVGAAGLAAAGAGAGIPMLALAQTTQGVTKNEIVIGTIQDLSGPIVSIGKPLLNGMNMRIDQINAAGGVNGRKIKLLVEDSGYDPKRAVLAAQKLVTSDRVFAMVNVLGTAVTLATAPVIVDKGILDLFPISAHRGNWEPFHKLKFAILTPFEVGIKAGLNEMIKRKGYKRVAILYQDDELGQDILRATEEVLKDQNLPLVEKASFKRGATDFASQAQRLVAAKPDTIVMATATRESIGGATAARLLGYSGDFLGSSASFQADVAKLGGPPLEGFYAIGEYPMMYRDDPKNSKELNEWMDAYNARFSSMPDVYSATGWASIDLFATALKNAGAEPTTESMVNALQNVKYAKTFLGNPEYAFGPTRRLGGAQIRVSQVKAGRWVPFTDYLPL
ncbi:ABC transporter substrate-binding protein [Caenimonas aquaedulcis]|uniref:ABC transporter substrate-binding protein n=1 Tax=Caenimonas aquaedulcis TaxID=2793270 RepID=A0A931H3P3_9BURK|nr:ABC transporter substrate-binding protein [Caenimonas aquaedulcis]MBG9388026.1 ABC transporter substrate-binding protein [Caenimonas aquaedulcis]